MGRLCAAETAFYAQRMSVFRKVAALSGVLARALAIPTQRGCALRVLEIRPEPAIREHVGALVGLPCWAHADTQLVRSVLLRIDRAWLVEHIDSIACEFLLADEEPYRRIAERYELIDPGLLNRHLDRCARHDLAEIRELAAAPT